MNQHYECDNNVPGCRKTGWSMVLAGSNFTTGAESRYSLAEGEALVEPPPSSS